MQRILIDVRALLGDRRGFTSLEYGLVAAFVSAALIAAIPGLAAGLSTFVTRVLARMG